MNIFMSHTLQLRVTKGHVCFTDFLWVKILNSVSAAEVRGWLGCGLLQSVQVGLRSFRTCSH
jgi:hypothetical protein